MVSGPPRQVLHSSRLLYTDLTQKKLGIDQVLEKPHFVVVGRRVHV